MTTVSSLAFPGSKTLAGWWRQLAAHQPRAFGVGYLFIHRVEVPVSLARLRKIDRFVQLLLQALDRETARAGPNRGGEGPDLLARLESRLHLGRQALFQVLRSVQAEELTLDNPPGSWQLTAKGRLALAHGEYPIEAFERRVLCFLERWDESGARLQPPHFVNLRGNAGQAWSGADSCPFEIGLVRDTLQQAKEWKTRFGFPLEILQIRDTSLPAGEDGPGNPAAWQRVIVDRPERLLVAWALVPGPANSCLRAFSARQDGWALQTAEPLLHVAEGWEELFPTLAVEPDRNMLQKAWQAWAKSRGIGEADAAACSLALTGHRLEVHTGHNVLERLKKAKSDVFKGDAWLLIGEGHIRTAVQLQVR